MVVNLIYNSGGLEKCGGEEWWWWWWRVAWGGGVGGGGEDVKAAAGLTAATEQLSSLATTDMIGDAGDEEKVSSAWG
jgi:hypothetical protein